MAHNEQQWSSATPGLLIILLDQSGSMKENYPQTNESKIEYASKAVNRVIDTIIQKNFSGTKPKNRCFITVFGYGTDVKTLVSDYLDKLDENPIRVENVKKKVLDGAGGLVEIDTKMPIWVEPYTSGCTNMIGAFDMAKSLIESWMNDKPDNPAPVIINISDGIPYFDGKDVNVCMNETIAKANEIKEIITKDGKVQIFNAMIGDGQKVMFPSSEAEATDEEAKFLYEISTEIPESYRSAAIKNFGEEQQNGFAQGARGAIYNADAENLIKLIDFGSSKGLGDK